VAASVPRGPSSRRVRRRVQPGHRVRRVANRPLARPGHQHDRHRAHRGDHRARLAANLLPARPSPHDPRPLVVSAPCNLAYHRVRPWHLGPARS
jgi:hypothetical protein